MQKKDNFEMRKNDDDLQEEIEESKRNLNTTKNEKKFMKNISKLLEKYHNYIQKTCGNKNIPPKFTFDEMVNKLHFSCQNCGDCCSHQKGGIIIVDEDDMSDIPKSNIIEKNGEKYLKQINGVCSFYDKQNKKCKIYNIRIKNCRYFPYFKLPAITNDFFGAFHVDFLCPGTIEVGRKIIKFYDEKPKEYWDEIRKDKQVVEEIKRDLAKYQHDIRNGNIEKIPDGLKKASFIYLVAFTNVYLLSDLLGIIPELVNELVKRDIIKR